MRAARPRVDASKAHDGTIRVMARAGEEARLEALLSLLDNCILAEIDLDSRIDDRRINIVDVHDAFGEPAMAQLEAALLASAPGRGEAVRAVRENADLRSVLERRGIREEDVIALQLGANGMTEVFARLPDEAGGVVQGYAAPQSEPSPIVPEESCGAERQAALSGPPDGRRIPLAGGPATAILTELSVEPETEAPTVPDIDIAAAIELEASTGAAASLGLVLDQLARLDALLLSLDRPEIGGVRVSDLSATDVPAGDIVLASHALAEAIGRVGGPGIVIVQGARPQPRIAQNDGAIERRALPAAGAAGGRIHAADLSERSPRGWFLEPNVSGMQFEAEAVEADACKEFLDALLDELDRLSGISIDAAADVEVVPVRDCSPLRFDRRVTAPLREVLVSDALVRRRVRAAGYETSDIIGGSVGESSVVSVYVAR